MPAGPRLSPEEQGMVLALHKAGKSQSEMETLVGRSRKAVMHFLANRESYNVNKRKGRPPKVIPQDVQRLFRKASNALIISRELVDALQLFIKPRQVRPLLSSAPHLKYVKAKTAPLLTDQHKKNRQSWAMEKVVWTAEQWQNVVFSDDKKVQPGWPDGLKCHWHDLRKETHVLSKRQWGGGNVMVWAGFSTVGKTKLCILDGFQDSTAYIWTQPEYLLPFIDLHYRRDSIFQQDNAPIHSSIETKAFF
ncbi:hypothetical protein AaE_013767 [Aphanomyces astaci]|uniref:Tc3 transposase DNA binding domain-containing protein n=1 Tax=Aphanomyces astaci TaxID=112090 RepID=A0A6A4ZI45_APHAT|nr:hypothetical protein AaE_013767 [Aphanomyces astaci]